MKSIDEYSISVEGQRGLKEFQYDQVFMEDSTQEKIFEDTNVSLSSFRIPVSVLAADDNFKFCCSFKNNK